jgi:hypothetical protein
VKKKKKKIRFKVGPVHVWPGQSLMLLNVMGQEINTFRSFHDDDDADDESRSRFVFNS